MRFYNVAHQYYCGIDLHRRRLYLCIIDSDGQIRYHHPIPACPKALLEALASYREDVVVGCECMHTWYWVADLCSDEDIPFVLGHALYMKAIHGGKAKNDRIDSEKIAILLRGGAFPMAYVYPRDMRSTRDLLRRRLVLVQQKTGIFAHLGTLNAQINLPAFDKRITYRKNREGLEQRFEDPSMRLSAEVDCAVVDLLEEQIHLIELFVERRVKKYDGQLYYLLRTIPGVGKILALTIIHEVHDIHRFPSVGNFASYARLVRCGHESNGRKKGFGGAKMGNVHLKWAFSEMAALYQRANPRGQRLLEQLQKLHGAAKGMTLLAHKLGRAVYFIMKRKQPFDHERFLGQAA